MDKPPLKKKRLIKDDSDSDDGGFDLPSTLSSSDRSDKKVSFAPSSSQPTAPQTSQPSSEEQLNSDNDSNKKRQPRLVMKKMILNNFKSYAGRQVIGPFHKVNTDNKPSSSSIVLTVMFFSFSLLVLVKYTF